MSSPAGPDADPPTGGPEPRGYERPPGWTPLGGDPPPEASPPRRRRRRRRPAPQGSARQEAVQAKQQAAATKNQAASPGATASGLRATLPASKVTGSSFRWVLLLGVGAVLVAMLVAGFVREARRPADPPRRPTPRTTTTTSPRPAPLPTDWVVSAASLRAGAEFRTAPEGLIEGPAVIDGGAVWVVVTKASGGGDVVHGLAASSGRDVWSRPYEDAYCTAAGEGLVACAGQLARDDHGLGVRWRLDLLDAATGAARASRELDATLSGLALTPAGIVVIEQRQPAPHAVLTALAPGDLTQRWQLDLAGVAGQERLFSNNRIVVRDLPVPEGPALDRPRFRTVAGGRLLAFWSGSGTVFVEPASGRLAGLLACSRLVDDGVRLWCNDGPSAQSHSYDLTPLARTDSDVRLAFPGRDPRAGDVTHPVFTQPEGNAVRVDPTTGRTLGPLVASSNGSAFGMVISPWVHAIGQQITLIGDSSRVASIDPVGGSVIWSVPSLDRADDVYAHGGELLLTGRVTRLVDRATGKVLTSWRRSVGYDTVPVGDAYASVDADEVARTTLP